MTDNTPQKPSGLIEFVNIGELKVSKNPNQAYAIENLTSGVAVILHDGAQAIGGIAYIFLPDSAMAGGADEDNEGKFADLAIPKLIERFQEMGGQQQSTSVRLVGGSQLFNFGGGGANSMNVGNRNDMAIRTILSNLGWVITKADVGGNKGRKVKFTVGNGRIAIAQAGQDFYEV